MSETKQTVPRCHEADSIWPRLCCDWLYVMKQIQNKNSHVTWRIQLAAAVQGRCAAIRWLRHVSDTKQKHGPRIQNKNTVANEGCAVQNINRFLKLGLHVLQKYLLVGKQK